MAEPRRGGGEERLIFAGGEEHVALLETEIAALVLTLCEVTGSEEVRLPQALIEEPPEIEQDIDALTGEWVYRLKAEPR